MQETLSFHKTILCLAFLLIVTLNAPDQDRVGHVPGYPTDYPTKIYSGYLDTDSQDRKLHYIFVQSNNGENNKDPITLWLNGGPGCSSLLGFLQQIGPYYLQDGKHYHNGDNLTKNPYSWHRISNLLFIQSPAGVGYSYSNNASFEYNDMSTGDDNIAAVLSFFQKFKEYKDKKFWIAGQSYAGKYIPDLAVRIDAYNKKTGVQKITFEGILIGNGIMNWQGGSKQKSVKQYMLDHDFIDPDLYIYYERSCKNDPFSAGCQYFQFQYLENTREVNPYNIYGYCYYNDTQNQTQNQNRKFLDEATILSNIRMGRKLDYQQTTKNGAPCLYFGGVYAYFNTHQQAFHAPAGWEWNGPCAKNISAKYIPDISGSMYQYLHLIPLDYLHIVMYNGDWDAAVTYTDTIKNLQKLNLVPSYLQYLGYLFSTPFFVDNQHAGFIQIYSGIIFTIVKGASHMVPQSKRPVGFELFRATLAADQLKAQLQNGEPVIRLG